MKFIEIEDVASDQIMIIQNELYDLYYVVVESAQNYSFTPDYVSKPFKTKKAAVNLFNKVVAKYKANLS